MPDAGEIDEIKAAFSSALKTRSGQIDLAGLITVFQDLDDWSKEDLTAIFDEVDKEKRGTISYTDFIDWTMRDDDAPVAGEEGAQEDSDDDDGDMVAGAQAAGGAGMDLSQKVTLEEWIMVMHRYDTDEYEAKLTYEEAAKLMAEHGLSADGGVPAEDFLDDLQIDTEDKESLTDLANVVAEVKEKIARGEKDVHVDNHYVFPTALAHVIFFLDRDSKPAEAAFGMVESGEIYLSRAGKATIMEYKDKQDELVAKIKEFQLDPPLLPSTAGQVANRERCIFNVEEIVKQCKASGTKFTDTEFDMTKDMSNVLYVDKETEGYDCTVAKPAGVKRITELVDKPKLFKGGVSAGDICQGQVGTCFLLGAMGAIASNSSKAIEHVFMKYDMELGVYGVRFNVHGEWTHVIIDDYLPVDAHGRLLYARGKDPQEVWVPLLEKAYCKLHTCYEMCDGGRPNEAIFSFCGGASGKLAITKKHKADPKQYFKVLQNARAQGWLLTTTFVKTQGAKSGGGKCGEDVLPTGLVGGHVYSVLTVVEAHGVQLVCCRNPWGTGEWQGKWSDRNEFGEWTDEMKKATGYQGLNDGKFWMSIEDFVAASGGAEYARVFGPKWKKITQHGHFRQESVKATTMWAYAAGAGDELGFAKGATLEVVNMNPGWWYGNVEGAADKKGYFPANYVKLNSRPVARYDLTATATDASKKSLTVVVMLMQQNSKMARRYYKRKQDGLNYKDTTYPNLQLCIVGADGTSVLKREGKKRCISGEVQFAVGTPFKVYAFSVDGKGKGFSVRAYVKEGSLKMKEVPGASIEEVSGAMAA